MAAIVLAESGVIGATAEAYRATQERPLPECACAADNTYYGKNVPVPNAGRTLAIVGESGCGKSVTASTSRAPEALLKEAGVPNPSFTTWPS